MSHTGLTHEKPTMGGTVEWYTPGWLFELLGVWFDLDPCSPGAAITPWIPAGQHYTEVENGLKSPWWGRVWLNHPYAHDDEAWTDLFVRHGNGIGVCHARTDTPWCKYLMKKCGLVVFTKRIQFVDASGHPPLRLNKKTGKMQKSAPGCGQMLYAIGDTNCKAILHAAQSARLDGVAMRPR